MTGIPPSHVAARKSSRPVTATLRSDSNILHHKDSSPRRTPKRKGSRKRKLYGRATHKKLNLASENTCEENAHAAFPFEVLNANLLSDKLSETTFSARLLVRDAHLGKDGAGNNEYVERGTTLNLSTLGTDEMDDSECTSSSNDATGESCHCVTYLNNGSNTIHASEFNGCTFAKHGLGEENNIYHYQKLFCACVCNLDTADTIFSRSNNDNGEKCCINLGDRSSTGPNEMRMECHFGPHPNATHAEDTNDYFNSSSCCAKDVTDSSSQIERVQCSSEACSSKTSLQFNSRRKGRKSRKTPRCSDSTMCNRVVIGNGNRHKNGGKDSSVVWQKVEKGDKNVSRGGHMDDPPIQDKNAQEGTNKGIQHDITRHRTKHKQNKKACKQEVPNFEMKSTKEEADACNSFQTPSKIIYKKQVPFLHQQRGLPFKQGSQSLKNYYASKNGAPKVPKDYCQQEDFPPLQLVQVKYTGDTSTLSSCSADEVILTGVSRNCKAEGKESLQFGTEKAALSYLNFVPDLVPQAASWCSKNLYTDPCVAEREEMRCTKLALENNPQEFCKLDSPSGQFSQKWVPVGKEEVSNMINLDVSEISVIEGLVPANTYDSVGCASTATGVIKLASELTSKLNSYEHIDLKWPTYKGTDTSYNKITEAISDVYVARQRVEDVQHRIGRPLADFERFVYAASPVLRCTPCPTGCKSYLQECTKNDLCLHQTSDISLSSVWQWYEEPGCYGLEVKARDFHRSKGLWNSQFTTYFVPYLSAVQLFHQPRRLSGGSIDKEAVDMDMTCETSPRLNLPPIFAKLLPPQKSKPRKRSSTLQTEGDLQSSSAELIFEYFESEQPYSRRQLFDKVNELIAGVKPLNCHISGDPKNLELNLHDLHPTSWYCVAWYPIYRIPDGKFQAAFLTYHSLGHRVHWSSSAYQAGQTPVAFPVIGLQSYNDKAESWYQMSKSDSEDVDLAESRAGEASLVLKERLRTLNEAAGMMSRTVVLNKNGVLSRNGHPDYEFFLSRS